MIDTKQPNLEERLAETNAWFFLKEFSFSETEIKLPTRTEIELADHIVCIDNILIVFQLKQRPNPTNDPAQEANWYRNKVLGKAMKQIRDTVSYLAANEIKLENGRGHSVDLPKDLTGLRFLKIVIYDSSEILPAENSKQKGHNSSSVGFIHLMHIRDYIGITHGLVTLTEIVDYFEYREKLCLKFQTETNAVSEQALVGHYIRGDETIIPTAADESLLSALGDSADFEIHFILQLLKDRTYSIRTGDGSPAHLEYYRILKELLYLNRTALKEFKRRFMWAWNICGGEPNRPLRFADTHRGCGFVFIPMPKGTEQNAAPVLQDLTILAKYDFHMDRCIGLVFRRDGEIRLIDWMYYESKWKEDPEIESFLKKSYPFVRVQTAQKSRYPG